MPPRLLTLFWEITHACTLHCLHCRADAGERRNNELTTTEALAIADQIGDLGVKTVVLTGGDPILRPDWAELTRRLTGAGVRVRLFTSGMGFTATVIRQALQAGVTEVAVSLDGPAAVHNQLRPHRVMPRRRTNKFRWFGRRASTDRSDIEETPTAYDAAISSIRQLVCCERLGLRVVTVVNQITAPTLPQTYDLLRKLAVKQWQLHLGQQTGRADRNAAQLFTAPQHVEAAIAILLQAARDKVVHAPLHCTLGYMTAEEPVLRGRELPSRPFWHGCPAGLKTAAIGPDGSVKGCTTLPDEFITGSLRERSLADIWADDNCFPYSRNWTETNLAGSCAACAFGKQCRAGCPTVAYSSTGSIGLNPYCLRIIRQTRDSSANE